MVFLAFAFILLAVGLLGLWSGSAGYGMSSRSGNSDYFVMRQLAFLLPAFAVFLVCALLPLDSLRSLAFPIVGLSLAFLSLPIIPGIGKTLNGASRWIQIFGISLQPSELWKPVLLFYVAHIIDKKRDSLAASAEALFAPLVVIGIGSYIIFAQMNASTAILVALGAMSVFWASGVRLRHLAAIVSILVPIGFFSIVLSDYRMQRVVSFLQVEQSTQAQSTQSEIAARAIYAGGLLGKGVGLGTRKLASIPIVQSDFLIAAIAEEIGFVGVIGIMALWAAFFARGFRIAFRAEGFRSSLALGLSFTLCLQVLANLAVVVGAMPVTGLGMPLFSAGGSSLIMVGISVGLLYNCSRPGGSL